MGLFSKKHTTEQTEQADLLGSEGYERLIKRILTGEGPYGGAWDDLVETVEESRDMDYLEQLRAGAEELSNGPGVWASDPERVEYWVEDLVRRINAQLRAVRPRPPEPQAIVGVTFYQEALRGILERSGGKYQTTQAGKLVPEPDNPHDENAVAVEIKGERIGHLAREVAAQYSPGLQRLDKPLSCRVTVARNMGVEGKEQMLIAHFYQPLPPPSELSR